ncbi:MAG: protein-glutamine glutaminase family protein [Bacteroidota bacterium]|nr:protein-glutamine glutaminase family protein [Bacteroidota bacterium]
MIKSLFKNEISDVIDSENAMTKENAKAIFNFFHKSKLFRWQDANNDCEDRANAICILLDEWNIPNAKSWVFSGYMFKKKGYLENMWKYHVATILPVKENEKINFYAIDPATNRHLTLVKDWAENVTDNPHSYYILKNGTNYIFDPRTIKNKTWSKRNKGNFNWTMQGLAGINGLSSKGKATLAFNKKKVMKTKDAFIKLKKEKISF